jgi:two-component system, OmpR family, alkaline phosphatase synthesis response regulator PhoP
MMQSILSIEDDSAVQKSLKRLFEPEGYRVDAAKNGAFGLELFRKLTPSVILLDLRLPDIPGEEVFRQIRQVAPGLPVVILSAKTDEADKILLLDLGASDYVTKPFSPRELLARVRVALRRTRAQDGDVFRFDNVAVNFPKAEVTRDGQRVFLTAKEFGALTFMIRNAGRLITRDELLREVWGFQQYPKTRTVDNHIMKLRHKLERDPSRPVHFRTITCLGYKFVPYSERLVSQVA